MLAKGGAYRDCKDLDMKTETLPSNELPPFG